VCVWYAKMIVRMQLAMRGMAASGLKVVLVRSS
jgi:hypothetical protein